MSNILTSISFSAPDLDKASGPNYIENCHQISQIKILQGKLRSLSTSVPPVGQCRPPVDQCRTRGSTDFERERIHRRPIKNIGSYCNFTVFLTVNTVKFIISLHPVPVRSLIYH